MTRASSPSTRRFSSLTGADSPKWDGGRLPSRSGRARGDTLFGPINRIIDANRSPLHDTLSAPHPTRIARERGLLLAIRMGTAFEVVVVGAGPAGSLCALLLARRGARVLIVDRAQYGRDKACGEGLMPRGVAVLERAGLRHLLLGSREFSGIAFRCGEARVAGEFRDSTGRGVRRTSFDAALVDAAARAGAEVRFGAFARSLDLAGRRPLLRVCSTDSEERLCPRLVVVADGGRSTLRSEFGPRASTGRIGIVAHLAANAWTGFDLRHSKRRKNPAPCVEAIFAEGWQAVFTPVGDAVSIAALVEPWRAPELAQGASCWLERRLREHAEITGKLECEVRCVPLRAGAARTFHNGVLLLGDAAGAVDPIVGCGISLALESAEAAAPIIARAVDSGDLGSRLAGPPDGRAASSRMTAR